MEAGGGGRGDEVSEDTNSESYLDWKLGALPESQRTELLRAWRKLETLLGDEVRFQEDVCIEAMHKYGKIPVAEWAFGAYLNNEQTRNGASSSESSSSSSNYINGAGGEHESEQVSKW